MAATRTFVADVVSVTDVHPHLRRVVVRGDDLAGFAATGPDTFVYVLLPPPGRDELTIDQTFTWAGFEQLPESDRPVGAYYTVRRWDPASAGVDDADGAPRRQRPGVGLGGAGGARRSGGVVGPRTAYHPPDEPTGTSSSPTTPASQRSP